MQKNKNKKIMDEKKMLLNFMHPDVDFVTLYIFSFEISCRKVYINLLTSFWFSTFKYLLAK